MRNREEMELDVLKAFSEGAERKTRAMRTANINGSAGDEILSDLMDQGYVRRVLRKLKGIKGIVVLYELTYEGKEHLEALKR